MSNVHGVSWSVLHNALIEPLYCNFLALHVVAGAFAASSVDSALYKVKHFTAKMTVRTGAPQGYNVAPATWRLPSFQTTTTPTHVLSEYASHAHHGCSIVPLFPCSTLKTSSRSPSF